MGLFLDGMARVKFSLRSGGRTFWAVVGIVWGFVSWGAESGEAGGGLIPEVKAERRICFAMYAVHRGVLKLTAQLYPVPAGIDRDVYLDVRRGGGWKQVAQEKVAEKGWAATFRVEGWDASQDVPYRVRHGRVAEYDGVIRKDPAAKDTIVVAVFSGNETLGGEGAEVPKADLLSNIKKLKPDLLFFAGGQVCAGENHLAHWLRFGREFGEVLRGCPAVCLPDASDLGQAHLWGAGGIKSEKATGEDGGYFRSVEYVREVEGAQTGHLPDPFDRGVLDRGIGMYHTALTVGRVSFAIIDGRKFKSAPPLQVPATSATPDNREPRPWLVTTNAHGAAVLEVPGAQLLGERQEKFLRAWGADWADCDMKAVLTQAAFCGGAHRYGSWDFRVRADLDSNGWPKPGRDRALEELRRSFAVHIAGSGRPAAVFHHGIDGWGDAGYSFSAPPMVNTELRWWEPESKPAERAGGQGEGLGDLRDGFGNRVTPVAVANPSVETHAGGLTTRGAGFGVVRFNKTTGEVTFECWPRNVDIGARGAMQYPGWPVVIKREDNNRREPSGHLGEVSVKGATNPVVQVIDDASGEVLYTLHVKGATFRPGVYRDGPHTVIVIAGDKTKRFPGVLPAKSGGPSRLEADFSPPPPPAPEKGSRRSRR